MQKIKQFKLICSYRPMDCGSLFEYFEHIDYDQISHVHRDLPETEYHQY